MDIGTDNCVQIKRIKEILRHEEIILDSESATDIADLSLTKTVDRERSSLKIWNGLHMVKGKTKGHTERFQK